MKRPLKLLLIFIAVFVSYFSLLGLLSMDETHGFFYLTPTKIFIRTLVSVLITIQIWVMIVTRKNN